jgi:hypothetical protein
MVAFALGIQDQAETPFRTLVFTWLSTRWTNIILSSNMENEL